MPGCDEFNTTFSGSFFAKTRMSFAHDRRKISGADFS
jgi:hypothetical protein